LPFLPLFGNAAMADAAGSLNSSHAAHMVNLTFRVMVGKSGKMMARTATIGAR